MKTYLRVAEDGTQHWMDDAEMAAWVKERYPDLWQRSIDAAAEKARQEGYEAAVLEERRRQLAIMDLAPVHGYEGHALHDDLKRLQQRALSEGWSADQYAVQVLRLEGGLH